MEKVKRSSLNYTVVLIRQLLLRAENAVLKEPGKGLFSGDFMDLRNRPDILSVDGYAKLTWVLALGYLTSADIAHLATKGELPSLSGYATELWTLNQGFITSHQDLSAYALKTEITLLGAEVEELRNLVSSLRDYIEQKNVIIQDTGGYVIMDADIVSQETNENNDLIIPEFRVIEDNDGHIILL